MGSIVPRFGADRSGGDHFSVDVTRVASATAGFTGADLRELVSDAVLHVAGVVGDDARDGATVTTALLVQLAYTRRPAVRTGFYL